MHEHRGRATPSGGMLDELYVQTALALLQFGVGSTLSFF